MWISQYADNGWIRQLDDFIAADATTQIDDFLPEVLYSLNTWRGHLWDAAHRRLCPGHHVSHRRV